MGRQADGQVGRGKVDRQGGRKAGKWAGVGGQGWQTGWAGEMGGVQVERWAGRGRQEGRLAGREMGRWGETGVRKGVPLTLNSSSFSSCQTLYGNPMVGALRTLQPREMENRNQDGRNLLFYFVGNWKPPVFAWTDCL